MGKFELPSVFPLPRNVARHRFRGRTMAIAVIMLFHLCLGGQALARLLLDTMEKPLLEPQEILLPTELVIRSSTAVPARIHS